MLGIRATSSSASSGPPEPADPALRQNGLIIDGDVPETSGPSYFDDQADSPALVTALISGRNLLGLNETVVESRMYPFGEQDYLFRGQGWVYTGIVPGLQFGTGDFTIECWFTAHAANFTERPVFTIHTSSTGSSSIAAGGLAVTVVSHSTVGSIRVQNTGQAVGEVTYKVRTGIPHHMALVREGSLLRVYIDGVDVWNTTNTVNMQYQYLTIGNGINGAADAWLGRISNFRITTSALYSGMTFTPPSGPLSAVAGTIFLGLKEGLLRDLSSNNVSIVCGGNLNTKLGLVSPVPTEMFSYVPASYSTVIPAGRAGSVSSSLPVNNTTLDYTVEFFFKHTAGTLVSPIVVSTPAWRFTLSYTWNVTYTTKMYFEVNNAGTWTSLWPNGVNAQAISSTVEDNGFYANAWYHIAVTRVGSTWYMWVNGVRGPSASNALSLLDSGTVLIDNQRITISNLRVVRGSAVYSHATTSFAVPRSPLTAISGTQLLMCASSTHIELSANRTVTATGNAVISRDNPFLSERPIPTFAKKSVFFQSRSGRPGVLVNRSSKFAFPGDYTIEFWFLPQDNSTTAQNRTRALFQMLDDSVSATEAEATRHVLINANGNSLALIRMQTTSPFSYSNLIAGGTLQFGVWNHVALCRSSGTTRLFLNGTQVGSDYADATSYPARRLEVGAISGNVPVAGATPQSWASNNGATSQANFSNFRVVKSALYTANFTVPTEAFSPTAAANTSFLSLEGFATPVLDGDLLREDEGPLLINYGQGSGLEKMPTSPFFSPTQNYSHYFNGTTTAYLSAATANTYLGAANVTTTFTIEAWINRTTSGQMGIFSTMGTASGTSNIGVTLMINSSNQFQVMTGYHAATFFDTIAGTINIPVGVWVHVALTKTGNTYNLWVNGQLDVTGTSSRLPSSPTVVNQIPGIGKIYNSTTTSPSPAMFVGFISSVRVVANSLVYTSSFTPSLSPLTAISGTTLLIGNGSDKYTDDSTFARTITVGANMEIEESSPFGPSQRYNPLAHGASFYSPGGAFVPNAATDSSFALHTGTSDFTIEFWVYWMEGAGTSQTFFDLRRGDTAATQALPAINLSGTTVRGVYNGATYSAAGTLQSYAWNHVAFSRHGGRVRAYLNGATAVAAGTQQVVDPGDNLQAARLCVASFSGGQTTTNNFVGKISNIILRVGTGILGPTFTVSRNDTFKSYYGDTLVFRPTPQVLDTLGRIPFGGVGASYSNKSRFGGGALVFTGQQTLYTNNYTEFGYPNDIAIGTNDFTIETWIKPTVMPSGDQYIISYNTEGFRITSTGHIRFYYPGGVFLESLNPIDVSAWTHIAAVRFNSEIKLFINGVSQATVTNAGNFGYLSEGVAIGSNAAGNGNFYIGYLDNIRIARGRAFYKNNFTPSNVRLISE